jgi:hypothetical protein
MTLSATIVVFLIGLLFLQFSVSAQAQTGILLATTDEFGIPENNTFIRFAVNGTYTNVAFENITWQFTDLHLNNSGNNPPLNFKASTQDSNITITACQRTNPNNTSLRLRYRVMGNGTQTFNFGLNLIGGYWILSINGNNYLTQDKGWRILADGSIMVIGATGNVSVSYSFFAPGLGIPDDPNLPFQLKHSVGIVTAGSVAAALLIAVAIRHVGLRRKPEISRNIGNKMEELSRATEERNFEGERAP